MSNVTGDIAQYTPPLKHDMLYRGCPCFNLTKQEFRKLVKDNEIPDRINTYSKITGINDVYVKSYDNAVTINIKKFKQLMGMDINNSED